MAIYFKKEPKYPSTSKPGIFCYDPINEEKWEEYTGIDDDALDKYKFAIGTWEEISRQNISINLHKFEDLDFVNLKFDPDTNSPTEPPEGFLANTAENAETLQPKPPSDSRDFDDIFDGVFILVAGEDYPETGEKTHKFFLSAGPEGVVKGYVAYYSGDGVTEDREGMSEIITVFEKGFEWKRRDLLDSDIYFHEFFAAETFPHSAMEEFKLPTKPVINSDGSGPWRISKITPKNFYSAGSVGKAIFRTIGNVLSGDFDFTDDDDEGVGNLDLYFKYEWKPNLKHPRYSRVGEYSEDFNYQWNGAEWKPGKNILAEPITYKKPKDLFVGVPLIYSNEKPKSRSSVEAVSFANGAGLPIFHTPDTDEYMNSTAPIKVWFGVDRYRLDDQEEFNQSKFKFHVLEWGDEDVKLSNDEILNTEYFSMYNIEEGEFDRTQVKKLFQIIGKSKNISYRETIDGFIQDETYLDFYQHTYTEPGVYSIKTIIFRMLDSGEPDDVPVLIETKLINTNIVINDAGQSLEEFDVFGSSDFNVLPVSLDKKELIIGGLDKESDYIKSIKKMEKDDLYESGDYLEKTYNEKLLPLIDDSVYGDHPGKLDLATTRLFTKPYDISYFLNSKATDILIDDKDCLIELNPNEVNQNIIENTARSNDKAILIGDYKLIKKEKQEMIKEDNMDVPKIETRRENQAF